MIKKEIDQDPGGEYRQVYEEWIDRDKKYCGEREGIVAGLEKALAIVEIEEEKQNQAGDPPQPSQGPAHDSTG